MVKKINVKLPPAPTTSYPIWIGSGLLKKTDWLPKNLSASHIAIITDHTVKKKYAHTLIQLLKKQGYKPLLFSFSPGEKSKTEKTKAWLAEKMMQHQCNRNTLCIALGGGIVGDLTGYLAATYMRGVPYIQIPTTLLAMVDSSIGGKTGINTRYGKNLMGAFYQPKIVVVDIDYLKSLPKKHLINGLIEAIKVFLTNDKKSFFYTEKNLNRILEKDEACLKSILHRAIKLKANIVEQDEKESNLRMLVNFGHTIGHALEQICQYKMLHGYAVGLGILVEIKIAQIMGLLDNKSYLIIKTFLARLGFNPKELKKFNIEEIIRATRLDKKAREGKINYVLLKSIGQVHQVGKNVAHTVSDSIVRKAFLTLIKE